MKTKSIFGALLIIAAVVALGSKLLGGHSGHFDGGMVFFMLLIGLLLVLGIGRVLRN